MLSEIALLEGWPASHSLGACHDVDEIRPDVIATQGAATQQGGEAGSAVDSGEQSAVDASAAVTEKAVAGAEVDATVDEGAVFENWLGEELSEPAAVSDQTEPVGEADPVDKVTLQASPSATDPQSC